MLPSINNQPGMGISSPMIDACWKIRMKLDKMMSDKMMSGDPGVVIAVTSAVESEGKSAIAANLACSYAQNNKKVLLVDVNLSKPALHKIFGLSNRNGVSHLTGDRSEMIRPTPIPNLSLITSGVKSVYPVELLTSPNFQSFLKELRQEFDLIVVDTPPALHSTDAQIVASLSDGVLLVFRKGKVKKEEALKLKNLVDQVNAKLVGVVFNYTDRHSVNI